MTASTGVRRQVPPSSLYEGQAPSDSRFLNGVSELGHLLTLFVQSDGRCSRSGANYPCCDRHSSEVNFGPSHLKRLRISLPPLAEQRRIAGILDAVDALRAKRRETLAQLDTLLQSTFLDMFGDPVTNSNMGWRVGRLEDYVQRDTRWNLLRTIRQRAQVNMSTLQRRCSSVLGHRQIVKPNQFSPGAEASS